MEPAWSLDDYDEEELTALVRAARMYDHLRTGGALQPIETGVILGPDESAYLQEVLVYARYYSIEPSQARPWSDVSPLALVDTALRNWNARRQAEANWRDARRVRLVLTDRRLLVSIEGTWISFGHDQLMEFLPEPADLRVVLAYDATMPIRLTGLGAPALAVAIGTQLFTPNELADIPAFGILDAILRELV